MRVFLTGATGYVGSNLLLQLLIKPEISEIALLIRNQKGTQLIEELRSYQERINLVYGDLNDVSRLPLNYDVIIHAAAVRIPESEISPERAVQVNLLSTLELMQQAHRSGAGCFIFLSTQAVYDFKNNPLPVKESGLIDPGGVYGLTKFAAELGLQHIAGDHTMRWAVLRLARVYGLGLNTPWDQLIAKFCLESARGRQIKVWNGSNEYDFVHVRDVSDFVINLLFQCPENWNQVYNVGGGQIYSVNQLAETCRWAAYEMGLTPPEIIHTQNLEAAEQHFFLDISKARQQLGWEPRVSLSEGVRELICTAASSL